MVNRVCLGQRGSDYGLWVSKPGQNVLTASPAQLQFNSNWSGLGVAETGMRTFTITASFNTTIPFNRTYPSRPMVLFERRCGGSFFRQLGSGSSFAYEAEADVSETSRRRTSLRGTATRTGITLQGSASFSTGPTVSYITFTLRYTVFDYGF